MQDIVFVPGKIDTFKRSQYIYREGEKVTNVFRVSTGIVGSVKILADGGRLISHLYYPGDIFGLSPMETRRDDAMALTPAKVSRLSAVEFQRRVDDDPRLRKQLVDWLERQVAQLEDRAALFAKAKAEERICKFLLQFVFRSETDQAGDPNIEIPFKRADMADYLGVTIETVSRQLANLAHDGIIEPKGRYLFALRKPGALRRLAAANKGGVVEFQPQHRWCSGPELRAYG